MPREPFYAPERPVFLMLLSVVTQSGIYGSLMTGCLAGIVYHEDDFIRLLPEWRTGLENTRSQFDPVLGQYSFRWLLIVILFVTDFTPPSSLSVLFCRWSSGKVVSGLERILCRELVKRAPGKAWMVHWQPLYNCNNVEQQQQHQSINQSFSTTCIMYKWNIEFRQSNSRRPWNSKIEFANILKLSNHCI